MGLSEVFPAEGTIGPIPCVCSILSYQLRQ